MISNNVLSFFENIHRKNSDFFISECSAEVTFDETKGNLIEFHYYYSLLSNRDDLLSSDSVVTLAFRLCRLICNLSRLIAALHGKSI